MLGLRPFSVLLALVLPGVALAHSAPSLSPAPPLKVDGRRLIDANQREFVLQGVMMSGLEAVAPTDAQKRTVQAMTTQTFRVLRQRWNLNVLRLPVSPTVWRRDGKDYLIRVEQIVQKANAEGLVVVLVAADDTGFATTELADFWSAWSLYFKDNGLLIFDLFARPSAKSIPTWTAWQNGMQQLIDRIRATGAKQLISAAAFHDALDFQGFGPESYLNDANLTYEVHPYFDHALTDSQRDSQFGFLAAKFPLYAGEWGTPISEDSAACRSIPADPVKAGDAVSQLLVYMFFKPMHWTAASFEPTQLINDFDTYGPTNLNRPWTCGQTATPQPGIGAMLLLYLTGDPSGFGSLAADQMASAAGGPAGPIVPGQILVVYGQGIGPETPAPGVFDDSGKLATSIAGVEIRFDGIAAPIYAADYYQVKLQVPWELTGHETTKVQASYRGIPSNEVTVQVIDAGPGLFTSTASLVEALAANQDGTLNTTTQPAAPGTAVTLYATGLGPVAPQQETGRPAGPPYATPTLPITLTIGGTDAEILYAGVAPGLVGVMQINARIPQTTPTGSASVPLILTAGTRKAQTTVRLWVR